MFLGLNLEEWARVATIVSAVVAVFALGAIVIAWLQLAQAKVASANADANALYRSLLEKALEFPQFVAPDPKAVKPENGIETFDGEEKEFRRYEAFIDLMLTTFDELAPPFSDTRPDSYIVQWLSEHRTYLDSKYFRKNFWNQLSDNLQKYVEAGIAFDKTRSSPVGHSKKKVAA